MKNIDTIILPQNCMYFKIGRIEKDMVLGVHTCDIAYSFISATSLQRYNYWTSYWLYCLCVYIYSL